MQTRIDLWKPEMLELLGRAGCVSIEAGVESLTVDGRAALDKRCRMTTDELTDRLLQARQHVPFVQANLIETPPTMRSWSQPGAPGCRPAACGRTTRCRCIRIPARPDYRRAGASRTTTRGSARIALSRPVHPVLRHPGGAPLACRAGSRCAGRPDACACRPARREPSDHDRRGRRRVALQRGAGARLWPPGSALHAGGRRAAARSPHSGRSRADCRLHC